MGLAALIVAWIAWWGAVEPLNRKVVAEQRALEQVSLAVCGICAREINPEYDALCVHQCGRHFHKGCLDAKEKAFRGDSRLCAVCNVRVS